MLTDSEFVRYAAGLRLSSAAAAVIERVRTSAPARRGFSEHTNASGRFASDKMGRSIGYSARTTEGLGLLAYETTSEVIEFWEEPGIELRFEYETPGGAHRAGRFHPDALVLEDGGAFLDEWKTDEQLIRDAERMARRYVLVDGAWRSPSAEASASRLGLQFRLRTPASVDPQVRLNATFLRDYLRDAGAVSAAARTEIIEAVARDEGLTLAALFERLSVAAADDVFRLVSRGEIYVDLSRERLADTFYTHVFTTRTLALALQPRATLVDHRAAPDVDLRAGALVRWNEQLWTVLAATESQVILRANDGAMLPLDLAEASDLVGRGLLRSATVTSSEGVGDREPLAADLLRAASPDALRKAQQRLEALERHWKGRPVDASGRALRNWQRSFRLAESRCGLGFVGLIPKQRGRRAGAKVLDPLVEEIVNTAIASVYETAAAPTKTQLYGLVREACASKGLEPPGYQTVRRRVAARDAYERDRLRRGSKAAYATKDAYWYLATDTPQHGERPWEVVHLDHTELDLMLVDSEDGKPLGRPWLTLMVDAYSRRVVAYWVTFDEPSYRSLMMVMRRCVERWGRLPERLVVDGGAEFASTYLEQFAAMYRIELTVRPGEPRFGAVIERLFGTTNTRLIHGLSGNTKPTKDVRSMSREVDPRRTAVWTLASLGPVLDEFFFESYDTISHPALGISPRGFYERRMAQTGLRPVRLVANDETFFLATLPTTAKGTAKVDAAKGVKINGRHYRAVELRAPGVAGTHVPVRFDPMDIRHAYAYVNGTWVEGWCSSIRRFPRTSERAYESISAELRLRYREHNRRSSQSADSVAALLKAAMRDEDFLRQSRRDAELDLLVGKDPRASIRNNDHAVDDVALRPAEHDDRDRLEAALEAPSDELELYPAYV